MSTISQSVGWWCYVPGKLTAEEFIRAVVDIGYPAIDLVPLYHMQIMEGDIIRTIRANHEMIGEYHTAGNPGRHELDEFQEINYPPILQAIKETGYSGYIAHEFVPKGDPIASLRTAFQQCEPLL